MGASTEMLLMDLPTEILIHIASFLDASFVRTVFGRVNRRLHQLVADPIIWKLRISSRWPSKYPPVTPEEPPWDWARACVSREKFTSQWTKHETVKEKVKVRGHYSSVDTVLLMDHGLLVTGSRDRSLALWNIHQMEADSNGKAGLVQKWANVHKGWVWSLSKDASNASTLVSCGWDNIAHIWKPTNSEMVLENSVNCTTALLCSDIHSSSGTVVVGTFDKKSQNVRPSIGQAYGHERQASQNARLVSLCLTPILSLRDLGLGGRHLGHDGQEEQEGGLPPPLRQRQLPHVHGPFGRRMPMFSRRGQAWRPPFSQC